MAGDGTPRRVDLRRQRRSDLLHGEAKSAVQIGSEADLSIAELARSSGGPEPRHSRGHPGTPVTDAPPKRYVPSTARAAARLGLHTRVDLPDAVRRTADWHFRTNAYATGPDMTCLRPMESPREGHLLRRRGRQVSRGG